MRSRSCVDEWHTAPAKTPAADPRRPPARDDGMFLRESDRPELCLILSCASPWLAWTGLVLSIGNQELGIPKKKYRYQIGIWYLCLKFFGIFWVFYRNLEYDLVKSWFNIGIFRQNKIGLVFGFCGCHFIGIGLISVCHFPENGISRPDRAEVGLAIIGAGVDTVLQCEVRCKRRPSQAFLFAVFGAHWTRRA